jgi:hypothetical protein
MSFHVNSDPVEGLTMDDNRLIQGRAHSRKKLGRQEWGWIDFFGRAGRSRSTGQGRLTAWT